MIADVGGLYEALAGRLEQIVRRDVRAPRPVIEDSCQFAWVQLVRYAERIQQDRVLAWLATIARREAFKLSCRDRREPSLDVMLLEDGDLDLTSPLLGPHEQAERREQLRGLRNLSPRQREFLWMQAAGYSYAEIAAQHHGVTRRIIERQIGRGRGRLRAAA